MKISGCIVDEQGEDGTHECEPNRLADTEQRVYSHLESNLE